MAKEYYTDVVDNLPFSTTVQLYARHLPAWFAFCLAVWFRLRKWIGRSPKPTYGQAGPAQLVLQPTQQMPAPAQSRWARHFEILGDLGFRTLGCINNDTIGAKQESLTFLLHESGSTLVLLLWMRQGDGGSYAEEQTQIEFKSYNVDDTEIATLTLANKYMALAGIFNPDFIDMEVLSDRTPLDRVWKTHCDRPGMDAVIRMSHETAMRQYDEGRHRLFDYFIESGYLRQLTPHEVQHVSTLSLPD